MGCSKGLPRTMVNDPATKHSHYMIYLLNLCVLVILRQTILCIPYNPESEHINLTHITDFQSGVLDKRSVTVPKVYPFVTPPCQTIPKSVQMRKLWLWIP